MTFSFSFTETNQAVLQPFLDVHGNLLTPVVIDGAVGVLIYDAPREIQFVIGDGPTDVTATPQIAPGSFIGQELTLRGCSNTNTVTVHDGTGLALNGACTLGSGAVLKLIWNGFLWNEVCRNDL